MKVKADFDIIENPPADSHLWKQWKELVDTEGWTSDDNSVTLLVPGLKSTRSVFAVTKDAQQNYIGSVVWNEYDDICWLGFFLLYPQYRGQGIGTKIWAIAMERYSKNLTLSLRGVVKMAPKYKEKDTPEDGAILENYRMKAADFQNAFKDYRDLKLPQKLIRQLSGDDWKRFLDYDKLVTGRDRSEFLNLYYKKLYFTVGFAFYDESEQNIVGVISMVPTSHQKDNIFKVSPLFAESRDVAFYAMKTLSDYIMKEHSECTVVVHTVDIPDGNFNVFRKVFQDLGVTPGISGITLYSAPYPPKGTLEKVYIPHNNSCHFDY